MSARERILGRLRHQDAAGAASLPEPDVAAWYAGHQRNEDMPARAARLRAAMLASHAEVHDVTPSNWVTVLERIAAEKKLGNLLIGDGTAHGKALSENAGAAVHLLKYEQRYESLRDQLFNDIDAGFTKARSAIAETGTLILWPDAQEPRTMSLVPPVHIVLLDAAAIHADFHSAMIAENWRDGMPANALLISGPSKTADIQQTLAYGAHGPRELIVLLCQPESAIA
jgi:L-lactate dehydrogenase complex protein LldG